MGKDQNLITERLYGSKHLDFTFRCFADREVVNVLAHKAVVVAYSSRLDTLCQLAARCGMQKNGWYTIKFVFFLEIDIYPHFIPSQNMRSTFQHQ